MNLVQLWRRRSSVHLSHNHVTLPLESPSQISPFSCVLTVYQVHQTLPERNPRLMNHGTVTNDPSPYRPQPPFSMELFGHGPPPDMGGELRTCCARLCFRSNLEQRLIFLPGVRGLASLKLSHFQAS